MGMIVDANIAKVLWHITKERIIILYTIVELREVNVSAKNIPYDLDASYLEEIWAGECPIFHISLSRNHKGRGSSNSAHLDRIDPNKGYVKGNVAWISGRANRIKYNASIEELKQIVDWMERVTTIPKGSTIK